MIARALAPGACAKFDAMTVVVFFITLECRFQKQNIAMRIFKKKYWVNVNRSSHGDIM